MYLKNGHIKVELAVAKGKKLHDKRESERTREMEAEARAAIGRSEDSMRGSYRRGIRMEIKLEPKKRCGS